MTTMITQKNWDIRTPNPKLQAEFHNAFKVDTIIAQLLINRGITDLDEADSFLNADFSRLHDPFLLKDMDKAVKRIKQAQKKKERVLVYGDYDVDGVTSSALLHNSLKKLGIDVINHIPHRMHDGYGLNSNAGQLAENKGAQLIIAVDCGITAIHEVDIINKHGVDIIILDHHEPKEEGIPKAVAVVDPKRKDCSYPFKSLASVGLVAKLQQALFGSVCEEDLDLIALGTIADVVPLRGENRIFVKAGLPKLAKTKNKGLEALIDVAKIKGKKFRPFYVGFIIGPRINATGRMDTARKSLELLLADTKEKAHEIAKSMESLNTKRQKIQNEVIQEAISIVENEINFKDCKVIVLSKEGWHKGVLGIVASRITETYYRPSIIISLEDGVGTASARSIGGFELDEALAYCSDVLDEFGGHKQAAGLTIQEGKIDEFKDLINDYAGDSLENEKLVPTVRIDCEVPFSSLSLDLVEKVDSLQPYGQGNPDPVFCSRRLMVKSRPVILGKDTLKFWVTDGKVTISAVGFGMAKYYDLLSAGQTIDLAYQLLIDDWNKAPTVQLKIKDIRENNREV